MLNDEKLQCCLCCCYRHPNPCASPNPTHTQNIPPPPPSLHTQHTHPTDHYWWCPQPQMPIHPRNDAPRCLPCHFDETKAGVDVSKAPYRANKGCPCTPQLICTLPEFADVFHGGCDIPRHPQRTYSMHGGSGAIISVGLLRKVDLSFVEKCIQGDVSTGACV